MSRTITITLPLPPKALHPNARPNRFAKANATKRARAEACVVARSEFVRHGYIERWRQAQWTATYTFRTNHQRDEDNLTAWLKAYLDGAVTDARLLPGDDSRYLTMAAPPMVIVDKTKQEGVVLRFEEVTE